MHTRQQEWCRAQPTRSGPGRSAGGHGWARLCQFPGAAQTVSASLGHSGACTVPLGWCWGSTCGTWAPSPGSEEPWGPPGWCGRWDWPGPQGGCSSLRSLRSHRAIVGNASDGERLWPPILSWEEQSSADLGSYLGPGSQVWLSCSQGVLAAESASHEPRSGAPRRPFQQIFLS